MNMAKPQVELHIKDHGVITLELDDEKAPISAAQAPGDARPPSKGRHSMNRGNVPSVAMPSATAN